MDYLSIWKYLDLQELEIYISLGPLTHVKACPSSRNGSRVIKRI